MKRLAIFLLTMFFLTGLISCTNNAGGTSEDVASSSSSIVSSEPETSSIEVASGSIETIESIEESSSTVETKESTEASTEPTEESTDPTEESSVEPTTESTPEPTSIPESTATPTPKPTEEPTTESTPEPTVQPTVEPTVQPTVQPTSTPTPTYSTTLEKYLADGNLTDSECNTYATKLGATGYLVRKDCIMLVFNYGEYVLVLGTSADTGGIYIATAYFDSSGLIHFTYYCEAGANSDSKVQIYSDGTYCTVEEIVYFENLVNYMASHSDPNVMPSLDNVEWWPW